MEHRPGAAPHRPGGHAKLFSGGFGSEYPQQQAMERGEAQGEADKKQCLRDPHEFHGVHGFGVLPAEEQETPDPDQRKRRIEKHVPRQQHGNDSQGQPTPGGQMHSPKQDQKQVGREGGCPGAHECDQASFPRRFRLRVRDRTNPAASFPEDGVKLEAGHDADAADGGPAADRRDGMPELMNELGADGPGQDRSRKNEERTDACEFIHRGYHNGSYRMIAHANTAAGRGQSQFQVYGFRCLYSDRIVGASPARETTVYGNGERDETRGVV